MSDRVLFTVELTAAHAQALAQFLKRVGWSEMRSCAVDDQEATLIREALAGVQHEVNDAGFDPR
jgi:hypothetical protein